VGIIAVGGTLVFIAGGFDLSVGAISGYAGITAAQAFNSTGAGLWGSFILGALVGLGFGIANGLLVTIGRVNPFIATLATSIIINGLGQLVTSGNLVSVQADRFTTLGLGTVWGIAYPVFVWFGFALICGFLLSRTMLGRYIYAVGGNPEAARLSGIKVWAVLLFVYAFSGLMSGLGGVMSASRLFAANGLQLGQSYELDAIAAVILGGTSFVGGVGSILGTLIGALIIAVLTNGLVLLGVSDIWQYIIKGIVIIGAVALDRYRQSGART